MEPYLGSYLGSYLAALFCCQGGDWSGLGLGSGWTRYLIGTWTQTRIQTWLGTRIWSGIAAREPKHGSGRGSATQPLVLTLSGTWNGGGAYGHLIGAQGSPRRENRAQNMTLNRETPKRTHLKIFFAFLLSK